MGFQVHAAGIEADAFADQCHGCQGLLGALAWLSSGAVLHADETGVRGCVALRHGEKGASTRTAQGSLVVNRQLPTLLACEGLYPFAVERRR